MVDYMKNIEKSEGYKKGEIKLADKDINDKTKVVIKFIYEGGDNIHANVRDKIRFRSESQR